VEDADVKVVRHGNADDQRQRTDGRERQPPLPSRPCVLRARRLEVRL
jgi:hypothetical protein